MPRKSKKVHQLVRKEHVKYESLSPDTVKKYKTGVRRFWFWVRLVTGKRPKSVRELDFLSGEFINFLYQDERPLGWASDFLCGLKRLYPFCRKYLESANQYHRNWAKAVVRRRACPLPWKVVKGMIGMALIEGRRELGLALYLGFAGLFRASELIFLRLGHIKIMGEARAIISLRESKTAVRMANAESVIIKDACLVNLLRCRIDAGRSDELLLSMKYNDLSAALKGCAEFSGVAHPHVTPHSLRRGGATWHFKRCLNMDVAHAFR